MGEGDPHHHVRHSGIVLTLTLSVRREPSDVGPVSLSTARARHSTEQPELSSPF